MQDKKHWYDGNIYNRFIAPNQDEIFHVIKGIIEPGSTVIDVGCGTGRFAFSAADKLKSITGIDLSLKNITTAKMLLSKNPESKISFYHTTINDIAKENKKFDYAVLTYVIHEVNPEERVPLLKEIAEVADKIIIGDFKVPSPNSLAKAVNGLAEFIAGKEHFRNYKDYKASGGLDFIINQAGLKKISEIKNMPNVTHIVTITK